jgi:hypothetical protein
MRFVRVISADPACQPNCPEWLSAEGRIEPGSATAFVAAIDALKGRRLPILLHSLGGSAPDAMAMGALIRASGLAVAVARTLITDCPETAPKCSDGPAKAITGGATCASACVLVLAGGVERLAGPAALIGVHQSTTLVKASEGAAHLTLTRKFYEEPRFDAAMEAYLAEMGVGAPVMALMRKTPAASIRWLSLADLETSRLATGALDAASPILASGANGLNGHALEGGAPDLIQATADMNAGGATIAIAFRYRRGGGAIEAEAVERDAPRAADAPFPARTLTLSAAGAESFELRTGGAALIPRQRFCALAQGGASIAAATSGGPQGAPVELAAMESAKTLIAEACP